MKKLIAAFLLIISLSNVAIADCDFSTVVHNADGTMTYTKELHICVGQMKADLDSANAQIADYQRAISLKDLAITDSQNRSDIWMKSTFSLQDRIDKVDEYKSKNELLYFIGGVVFTGLAVWGAGQLHH